MRRPASDEAICLERCWIYGSLGRQRRSHSYRGQQRSRRLALKLSLVSRTSFSDNPRNLLFQFGHWHVLKRRTELLQCLRARSPLSVEPCQPLEIFDRHEGSDRDAGLLNENPGLFTIDLVDETGESGLDVGNLQSSLCWLLPDHPSSIESVSV